MRRLTDIFRNLLGLDDGATTTVAKLEDSRQRVRWRIGVGASLVVGVTAVVITIVISSISSLGASEVIPAELLVTPAEGSAVDSSEGDVFVHVVGAVNAPGLYTVGSDARVIDAVMAAGGLAVSADPCAINLAYSLQDGQQLVIAATVDGLPGDQARCDSSPMTGSTSGNGATEKVDAALGGVGLVSLSAAGIAELDTLPGIGPALAQRIIDWREASGGYTSVEQLSEVSGIGDKVMDNIRELVTL